MICKDQKFGNNNCTFQTLQDRNRSVLNEHDSQAFLNQERFQLRRSDNHQFSYQLRSSPRRRNVVKKGKPTKYQNEVTHKFYLENRSKKVRKFKLLSSLALRKPNLDLSSKKLLRSIHDLFFHHILKSSAELTKKYGNAPSRNKLQTKGIFLRMKTLKALKNALLVHPFKIWKLRDKFSSMEDIRIHEDKLQTAIDKQSNERLTHKLYKVLRGEDVFLDVFGGSNTVGSGLKKDEGDVEGRYTGVITHWWNKTITPITGSHLKLRQIALGGTSSEFFQFCFVSYIHKILDLVFIEMSVNDNRKLPFNTNKSLPLEQLTRQLLMYPTEPALIYINLFKGVFCNKRCTNLEDYGQDILTDTYNITSLKWRNAVCFQDTRKNVKLNPCRLISSDGYHINQLGHAHISLMVINLFRKILLNQISSVNTLLYHKNILSTKIPLPSPFFIDKTTKIISEPLCWTNVFPNYDRTADVKNNLDVILKKTKGFYQEKTKLAEESNNSLDRLDAYISWSGKTLGANMRLFFTVPGKNSSQNIENRTRSVAVGIRTCWNCGAADMWLDSDYEYKKFVNTKLHHERTSMTILAVNVEPGGHTVNVEIVKAGKVSIVAIAVGPSDGPY